MKLDKEIAIASIAALMAVSPAIGVIQSKSSIVQAATDDSQEEQVLSLTHNAYVYDDRGKRKPTYYGAKNPVLTVGAQIDYNGYGTSKIKGKKYYYVGDKGFVKAANIKLVDNKVKPGTLRLNYNTYVYDKNGKRLKTYQGSKKNTLLHMWHTVKYAGTMQSITNDSKKYYCLDDNNYNQSWLPYQTIKGSQYYDIGNGGYIKVANVDQIDGKKLYISDVTLKVHASPNLKHPAVGVLKFTGVPYGNKQLQDKQKVTIDRRTTGTEGNGFTTYYHIKGTNGEYIPKNNINVNDLPRQPLEYYTEFTNTTVLNDTVSYNVQGQPTNDGNLKKGTSAAVNELLYIWVPSENKAELFYRRAFRSVTPDTILPKGNLNYVKAVDVKYVSGPWLGKPENTPEEAKADIAIAQPTDKQELQKLISQENTVKADPNYKNSNYDFKYDYDGALKTAKDVNSSSKSTIAEVKQATWFLARSQKALLAQSDPQ